MDLSSAVGSPGARILELGAGTGLAGIAAASIFRVPVVLTDLPDIQSNLRANTLANYGEITLHGGDAMTGALDWRQPGTITDVTRFILASPFPEQSTDSEEIEATEDPESRFSLIMAADSLYDSEHPRLLVDTICRWLAETVDARVVISLPVRELYQAERHDFCERMRGAGFKVVQEDTKTGRDDWTDASGELQEVSCHWMIWAWNIAGEE